MEKALKTWQIQNDNWIKETIPTPIKRSHLQRNHFGNAKTCDESKPCKMAGKGIEPQLPKAQQDENV